MEDSRHQLTINRLINASIDKVWRAWTDTSELQKWWGPSGVTNPECTWEAQPGGKIDTVMLAGEELGELNGQKWPMDGQFKEVVPNKKLVFTSRALANGQPILETLCTVILEAQGNQTKLTLNVEVTKTTAAAEGPISGMEMGWNQSLDKLTLQAESSI